MMTNSSPPKRAATSISRALSARMAATNLIASSPAACPSRSLICLERVDVQLDHAVPAAQPLEHGELLGQRGVEVPAG